MGAARLALTVIALAGLTLVLVPLQSVAIRRGWSLAARLPCTWQRIACRLIGLRVRVVGSPAEAPVLLASNHLSWLDIPTLGSVMPVSFIAKSEIAKWPVAGTLARLQRTFFVERNRRSRTQRAAAEVAGRIGRGDIMVLFAEGTTGDGNRILPFRSALLAAARAVADANTVTIQPVALTYTGIGGVPVGFADRPRLAWYGDMDLAPHFLGLRTMMGIDAVVSFGAPIRVGHDFDRKEIGEACRVEVRRMLDAVRRGLPPNGHARPVFSPKPKGAKETGKSSPAETVVGSGDQGTPTSAL